MNENEGRCGGGCVEAVELPFFFTSADPYVLQKLLVTLEF